MPALRTVLVLSIALIACTIHAETPPAPWAAGASDSDASIAEWATGKLQPTAKKPPERPTLPPLTGDRYAKLSASAERLESPGDAAFAQGNPLRSTQSEKQGPVSPEEQLARQAFEKPAAAPARPAADLPALAMDAKPIHTPTVEEPTELVQIPIEAFAAPARPAASIDHEQSEPGPIRRVATAGRSTPPTFQPDFGAAPLKNNTGSAEGMGRPGPTALEGPQRASLIVEKRAPAEVRIGQPAKFAIRVLNTGDQAARNVVLTDQAPAGAKVISTEPAAQRQGGQIVWRLGSIAAGDKRIVHVTIQPTREGPIGSVATATMETTASASTQCTRPAVAIRIASPGKVHVGQTQSVEIEVHNPGTGAATGVLLLGDLPPQVKHPAGRELEYEVGALAAGETRKIQLHLEAATAGRVQSALRVVADGGLQQSAAFGFDVVAPSLAVSIEGPRRRYLERPASYKIGIDNPGTAPAHDVRLVTHLPQGMKFVRANNLGEYDEATHSVYWSLAELPDGQRGEVEVVAMPVSAGQHTLRVESEAAAGLKAKEEHRTAVDGVAALAFEVRDMSDPIGVGDETVYEIRVLNEGTKSATGVRVYVEAPGGMRILTAEGQTPGRTTPSRAEFAPLATLQPGQKVAYRVRVEGSEPGDQRVAVLVASDELTRPIRREESTRVFGDE